MVIVGLTQPEYVVTEGETVTVCAQLQSGQLGRDVTVFFVTSSDLGMYVPHRLLTFCTNCYGLDVCMHM